MCSRRGSFKSCSERFGDLESSKLLERKKVAEDLDQFCLFDAGFFLILKVISGLKLDLQGSSKGC